MAGNTKLRGFSPKGATLERWGGTAQVELSEESLAALRSACYEELPKKPNQDKTNDLLDLFDVGYDNSVGRIVVQLSPETAAQLAEILEELVGAATSPEEEHRLQLWVRDLKYFIDVHEEYVSPKGEPGVDGDGEKAI